jgi:uncharacterized protein
MNEHDKINRLKQLRAYRFFEGILSRPWLIIGLSMVFIILAGSQLPKMTIDTTVESFIPKSHPSIINRALVRKTFNITDPIVVAISSGGKNGTFTPELLNLIGELGDAFQQVEGVDPDQITSLATENNIYGTSDGIVVDPFIDGKIETQTQADSVRSSILRFPLYVGNLVSSDATTSLIIVELLDKEKYGAKAYFDIKKLTEEKLSSNQAYKGATAYVAGEGGVVAYQAAYIDGDAKKMTPLAFVTILLVLVLAYRTFRGLYLSVFVIVASVVGAMGIMAGLGVPMYLTSNIIPVILIATGVADAIHILGEYYEVLARNPGISSKEAVLATMTEMWRPVTMTSVTNVAGFMAMGFTSNVPPLQMVGVFSSIGVLIALLISLLGIPAILILLKPKFSGAYASNNEKVQSDVFGRGIERFGKAVLKYPRLIIFTAVATCLVGLTGTFQMKVEDASIDIFQKDNDIYVADRVINEKMNGSNSFDVMIETKEPEALFEPDNLQAIEKLQRYIESLPHVGGTTSIVDVIKQLNKSLNENKQEAYVVPSDKEMVAQLFLLYSSGGDPADLEQFIDYDHKLANISVLMKDGHYTKAKEVIVPLNEHIENNFNKESIKAKVAGWMNVFFYWIDGIAFSHFTGVGLALVLVWLITAWNFRSLIAGLYTVMPVFVAMLFFYAVLGWANIPINTASNIFGTIAIGVSVDFAIHIVEFLKLKVSNDGLTIDQALQRMYGSTGRALLFNMIAVCLGFGINMISDLPPFVQFGAMITTCVASSFLASMTLLPAMFKVFQPKFLAGTSDSVSDNSVARAKATSKV